MPFTPRSVTRALQGLADAQTMPADGLPVGDAATEGDADGDGVLPAVGVELQADATSAVTASARIQLAFFMSCSGNGSAAD
jgi:hypothetical protein